ncbi:hypothetical protein [Acanthopleuribacter pedis]|uniref:Uncharacterized protein n=1 Tax=Acanthopleuribacter pedis TaxID=442870 RepID=A0A8J7QIJ8_9BACT|nr:hypothetical protein [Acanthopleuribacter pedis]MBO1318968.1 hypothetical protein [Acanthopleuribacter pedis]
MSTLTLLFVLSFYDGSGSLPLVYKTLDGMHTAIRGSGKWAGKTLPQAELISMCDHLNQPLFPDVETWLASTTNIAIMREEDIKKFAQEAGIQVADGKHAVKGWIKESIAWKSPPTVVDKATANGAAQVAQIKDYETFILNTYSRPIIQIKAKDDQWQIYATTWPAATEDYNAAIKMASKLTNDINYAAAGFKKRTSEKIAQAEVLELPMFKNQYNGAFDELKSLFVFTESSQTFIVSNAARLGSVALTPEGYMVNDQLMIAGSFDFLTFEPKFFEDEDPFRMPGGRGSAEKIETDYLQKDPILVWICRQGYQFPIFVSLFGITGSGS